MERGTETFKTNTQNITQLRKTQQKSYMKPEKSKKSPTSPKQYGTQFLQTRSKLLKRGFPTHAHD